MPIKTGVKACVLALMIAAPWGAEAAGLGRLNVLSGLGQPFRGEIDLVSVQPEEADSLVVSLAPPEAFSAAQVPYPAGGLGLRFQIDKRGNGQYYVVVNSSQVISEPVLDLVVDLNWASGRIQRTYTALIDPVGYNNTNGNSGAAASNFSGTRTFGKPIVPSSPAVRSRGGSRRARAENKAPADTVASTPAAQAPAAAAGDNAGADSYTVKSGDTLSSIARSVQPGGVSLEQVLVSLYRNNSGAFDGNMNRLKRGRILQVPTPEKMAEVSRKDAAKEIHLQSQNWHAYRDQVAENAEKTPAADAGNQSTSGKIGAKVEDKGATEGQQSKDVLKLSKGADKAAANGGSKDAKEEARVGKQKELQDAQDRVNSLKKNVKDMKGLLALQGAASAAKATPTPEPTAAPTPAPTPVATVAPVVAAASAAASAPVAAVSDVASAPAAASAVASAPAVVHKRRVIPVTVPVAEPSLMDSIMDDPLVPGGILAVLLLGAGAFFYMRRRKKPAAFEDSIITGGDLKPNTVLGQTGGAVISTQPTENSFLTDFSRQGLGTIDTDEVDPIAEAEVYMAYGRDAQAEEILKDALSKDPSRHEIRMKLLEIYAARKDKTSFEEVATDLYAAQNGRGPLWEQAAYTGRTLDPENPLYGRTEGAAAAAVAAEPALGTGAALAGTAVAGAAVAGAAAAAEAARHDLDFDLGSDPVASAEPASLLAETPSPLAPQADAPMFDMPHLDAAAEPVAQDSTAADLAADLGNDLDFDLDQFSVPEAPAAPLAEPTLNPAIDSDPLADLNATADLDHDLDFGLDAGLEPSLAATPAAPEFAAEPDYSADLGSLEDTDLDLDLDLGALDMPEELAAAPAPAEAQDDLGLDFSFDLNEPVAASPAPAVPGLDTLDLALTPPPAGQDLQSSDFAGDDPVQTKIDLARAYIDMGDVEGAREILQEALGEGNANQQTEARSLLDAL